MKIMKASAVMALLIGIGTVPALAQTWDFTYTSANVTATGTLNGTEIGSTGSYDITSGTISTVTPDGDFSGIIDSNSADLSAEQADDVLYVNPQNDGSYLDHLGLLFSMSYGGDNEIWAGDNNNFNTSYSIWYGDDAYIDYPGTLTITQVPDGGTTLTLLGLAVAGLAGLRRKLSV